MINNKSHKTANFQQQNVQMGQDDLQATRSTIPITNYKPKFFQNLNNLHKKTKANVKRRSSLFADIKSSNIGKGTITKILDEGNFPWLIKDNMKIRGYRNSDGQFQGPVQFIHDNGIYFKGQFINGLQANGYVKFPNGFSYKGNLFNNQFQDFGILTFPNGKIVTGQWQKGYVEKDARVDYPTGQIYYGSLKNLKKHGQGHLFFCDNSKYIGNFEDGLIKGYGQYYKDQQLIASGQWTDGILNKQKSGSYVKKGSLVSLQLQSSLTDNDTQF